MRRIHLSDLIDIACVEFGRQEAMGATRSAYYPRRRGLGACFRSNATSRLPPIARVCINDGPAGANIVPCITIFEGDSGCFDRL